MQSLLGILPFVVTFLWTVVFFFRTPETKRSWRWSLVLACMALGVFVLILTEACSATHLLHFGPILIAWLTVSLTPLILLYLLRRSIHPLHEIEMLRTKLAAIPQWILLIITLTIALIIVMAMATPPMNFDVQIYHLPREIFWMMQGSVNSFAASNSHQISMPVLSEFLGLNLLILSGGDAWHNLVQTLFLAASCGMISLLVFCLGGRARAQGLAVITSLLLPVGFFEASNAKNDIFLSLFVLVPVFLGINIWTGRWKASVSLLLLASLAAGLALATKGTAIAYLPASALLILAACLRQQALRPLLLVILPGLLLAILPAAPQLMRNKSVFNSASGPNLSFTNFRHDPLSIAGVALRNSVGQCTCWSESWNLMLERKTRSLLSRVGLNADDPATTFEGQTFHLPYFAGLEDIVPDPIQTVLLFLLPLGLLIPSFRRYEGILPLFAVTFLSLLIFCLIFPWQPWQGRLMIPAYFMAAPMAGILLDLLRPTWLPLAITLLEILTLKPHLMFAGQRPLLGGASIFHMSKDAQMNRMMPGRAEEIARLSEYMKIHGKSESIMVDGGSTEIYGLLRGIHEALPLATLTSGHATNPSGCDLIVIPSVPYAGVAPPPPGAKPVHPPGFQPVWNGAYYWIFKPLPIK